MDNTVTTPTLASQLGDFASSLSTYINAGDVLTVMGIALGAGFGIYIVVWGAKKIVRSVKAAINGRLRQ